MCNNHPLTFRLALIAVVSVFLLLGCERPVSFSSQVQPILNTACISCHSGSGEGVTQTQLALDNYESVMRGTKLGPVVVPGSAVSSSLYLVINHLVDTKIQMPPHHDNKLAQGEGKALTTEQITVIKNWIEQGANNN